MHGKYLQTESLAIAGISPYLLQRKSFYGEDGWKQLIVRFELAPAASHDLLQESLKVTKTLYVGALASCKHI